MIFGDSIKIAEYRHDSMISLKGAFLDAVTSNASVNVIIMYVNLGKSDLFRSDYPFYCLALETIVLHSTFSYVKERK